MGVSEVQADVVGKLLVIQETLDIMPSVKGMAEFLNKALLEVPGVSAIYICYKGRLVLSEGVEFSCCSGNVQRPVDYLNHDCAIENIQGMKLMALRTLNAFCGYLILDLTDFEQFAPYDPFLRNICNVLSRTIENRESLQKLEEANLELQEARNELEQRVLQRTEQLRESEERYKSIFYDTSAVMFLIEVDSLKIVDANASASRFYGFNREELLNMNISDINIYPIEKIHEIFERLKNGKSHHLFARHKLASGEIREVESYDSPMKIQGKLHICSVIHDITERVKAQNSLVLFKKLIDQVNDAIFIINPETSKFLDVNDKACQSLGYTREELLSLSVVDVEGIIVDEPNWRKHVAQLRNSGPIVFESKHRRKDGSLFNVEINVKYIAIETNHYMVAVARDISERKRYENELLKTTQQLEELNMTLKERVEQEVEKNRLKDVLMYEQSRHAALGELLVNIAHHWRQPLCAIGIMVQDIEDAYMYDELDKEYIERSVKTMMNELTGLSKTLDDFKSFYVTDKSKVWFSLAASVEKSVSLMRDYLKSSDTTIDFDVDDKITLYGYPNEFSQVILNLLTNIKDVFEERKITNGIIRVTAYQGSQAEGVTLTISDNGGGVRDDILEKIFDPYFTTKEKSRGTGLGLYAARVIIEKYMNGTITAVNTAEGCEFRIKL
ncbi:MAG: PAS domain S-box protein [Nitrospirae bacterium]|nr:PAS domain S-box protein [Nitrospirota bacterium]